MQALITIALACLATTVLADPLRAEPAAGMSRADIAIMPPVNPRPTPPEPRPAPETAALGKLIAGTYKCGGAVDKIAIKLALDDAWVQWTIVGGAGTTVQYRTYDAIAKQWTMLELTSSRKHRTATSLGPVKDVWTWTADGQRELETFTKDKLELSGERQHGTQWAKNYTVTCQKSK